MPSMHQQRELPGHPNSGSKLSEVLVKNPYRAFVRYGNGNLLPINNNLMYKHRVIEVFFQCDTSHLNVIIPVKDFIRADIQSEYKKTPKDIEVYVKRDSTYWIRRFKLTVVDGGLERGVYVYYEDGVIKYIPERVLNGDTEFIS